MRARNRRSHLIGRVAGQRAGLGRSTSHPMHDGGYVATPRAASPAAPAAAAPAIPTPAQPAPFTPDASYLADAAQREFQRRTQIGQIDQQSSFDRTNHQEAIRRLREGLAPARQQTSQTAARQGLFYSGQLGKRLGEVQKDFTRREGDENTGFTQRQAARDAARRAIESGAPLEEAAALAAAADRQVQRDTAAAQSDALVPNPAPAAAPAAPRPAARPAPRAPSKRRGRARHTGARR